MGLRIIGTGRALPERMVTNDDLSAFLDTNNEWIVSKSGIRSRAICTEETLVDLAERAGRAALTQAGLKASDMDLIICSTMSGDFATPSLACCVTQRLAVHCPAFDVNAACTGFVYALDVAHAYLSVGKAAHVLIISADMMSRMVDWTDRSTCVLFGDGAGACVVTKGDALRYIRLTVGGDAELISMPAGTGNSPFARESKCSGYVRMRGQEVFKFAVQTVEREVKLALDELAMQPEDIDFFVLHQANKRIIDSVRTRLKQPEHKFPVNIDRYGNLSAASIPVLLDEMREDGRVKKGGTMLMIAFGAGMTTGTCVMTCD